MIYILGSFNKKAFNQREKKYMNQKEIIGMIFEEKDKNNISHRFEFKWKINQQELMTK